MPECQSCGSFVTREFVRVFGNNESEVFGCPDCTASSDRADGTVGRAGE